MIRADAIFRLIKRCGLIISALRPWQTRKHCCGRKCFPVCQRTQILRPRHKKCFWILSETFCVRNKCFRNNVSSFTTAFRLRIELYGSSHNRCHCVLFSWQDRLNSHIASLCVLMGTGQLLGQPDKYLGYDWDLTSIVLARTYSAILLLRLCVEPSLSSFGLYISLWKWRKEAILYNIWNTLLNHR